MNPVAEQLGEVGLPAPLSELAARDWDVVVVGGGHNGLTAAAYLAKAGRSVLVLERRERLGGACTLERPFADERYVVSPCAYVVGLLDELVIDELGLRERGLRFFVADPNLWVPFDDGTSFGQWLDDDKTQATSKRWASRRRTSTATGPTSSSSTTSASSCARARDTWVGETPDPRRDRSDAGRLAGDDRPRLRGLDRRRARRIPRRPAAQGRALRAGGDRHLGRPPRARHRLDQTHALPGGLRGPGPGLGLRRGRHGDGQLRDRRRRPGGRRDPRLRRPGRRGSSPARASRPRTGR